MRTNTFAILTVLGLLVATAGFALAQGNQSQSEHAAARQQAAQERRQELLDARAAVLEEFKATRATIVSDYRSSLNATRASYIENKTAVLERCNETRSQFTNNSESDTSPEHAKCVSEGLKPLVESARAANAAAREDAREKLTAARTTGMSEWAKARQAANEHYRGRTGENAPGA